MHNFIIYLDILFEYLGSFYGLINLLMLVFILFCFFIFVGELRLFRGD